MPFVAGQKLRAQALNDMVSAVAMTADVTVANSTAMVNAAGLAVPLAANSRYGLELWVWWTTNATADIRFQMSFPTGTTGRWSGGTGSVDLATPLVGTTGDNANISGSLVTTGAGTLQLRFSQDVATAVNTILRAGSWLRVTRLD